MLDITEMLRITVERKASDLHIAVGRPPVIRVDGSLINIDHPPLSAADTRRLIYGILTDIQKQKFEDAKDLDFSLSVTNVARFRVNAHFQRGSVAGAFRLIPSQIKSFDELNLPRQVCEFLCSRPNGLTLVTGPTGSGKSTTLAALIDKINSERACHIITAEDPIEYLHHHKTALVEQREVNEDTISFSTALKYALRQDPDVILVGEMRDLETISAAITAAETGHLVFSTLHTVDVVQTVDRVIDVFPPHQQEQIRIMLASVMEGIMSQRLLPSIKGGRCAAIEILLGTDAIRNMVREGKTHQVPAFMEAGAKYGMVTMDRALIDLVKKGSITRDLAIVNARKPEEVKKAIGGGGGSMSSSGMGGMGGGSGSMGGPPAGNPYAGSASPMGGMGGGSYGKK
ncbi:MAG: type IV pilus twitching motility protein PilT [Candidatus Sumerlaeia bacterium]|nr:type IV pilus twitching motility protein PilT [Candidatus Sumerlaeia bacterium]